MQYPCPFAISGVKYTREVLTPVVAASKSRAEVLRRLGLKQTGGSDKNIKRWIERYELDTSHFLGQRRNSGSEWKGRRPRTPEEILVLHDQLATPEKGSILRKALCDIGRAYHCEGCQIFQWCGETLTLQVDHRNGHRYDNRPGNLRFMCPNCHSLTPNFGRKNGAKGLVHGTRTGYGHYGCRCSECRAAESAYKRPYEKRARMRKLVDRPD